MAVKIGFIGLGQMGFHMANNLLKRSSANTIFGISDKVSSSLDRFKQQNPSAQILNSNDVPNIVFTMLPTSAHVKEVYSGPSGLFSRPFLKGSIFIDCSTIDPGTSKQIAAEAHAKSMIMVDAPVSGGTLGAENGSLTFMCGSKSSSDFDLVKPFLDKMGKNIVYCGSNGNGQVAKIANNLLLGISMVAASEAMNLGVELGMDAKLLAHIINTSSGRCWSTDTYNPYPGVLPGVPSSRNYSGGFGVKLMAKDMGLAVSAANEIKTSITLGAIAHEIYNKVGNTEGFQDKDFSSVFKLMYQK